MSKHRRIGIQFPLAGLNKRGAYRQQPPYSTPDALNVHAVGTIEGRERGGSRSGLFQSHLDDLGGAVRMLAPMTLALGDGFTAWSDTFSGLSMAAAWTAATWTTVPALPNILPSALASVDTTLTEGEAVRDALPIDTTAGYAVEVFLTPWNGAWHGDYRLYLRLDDTTPNIDTAGVVIELVQTGTTGAFTATLKSVVATTSTTIDTAGATVTPQPGWLTATVSGTTVTVYWLGTEIMSGTVGTHTGTRVGFGMECTVDGGLCLANVFRVQYYSTGSVPSLRSILIASADGNLNKETTYGRMTAVSSNLTVRNDVMLSAVQSAQKLYIADYGDLRVTGTDGATVGTALDATGVADWTTLGIDIHDDVVVISNVTGTAVAGTYKIQTVAAGNLTLTTTAGTGSCSYRIERAPKVYDPLLGTIAILTATTGQTPTGCPIIWRSGDRIYMAGAEIAPHAWYCCRRSSDGLDWDYSQTDSERAVAGSASEAGLPGEPIVAGLAHSDDYSIMAGLNSIWRLNGDPAFGGSLVTLSHTIGIAGQKAWCFGPAGELIFLSLNGLYALAPGGNSYPIPLSDNLPIEFRNINPTTVNAQLEYDVQTKNVHIYLTPDSANSRIHWLFNWDRKTFWPISLSADYEPTCTCTIQATTVEDSGILLGCRDGKLRRYSELAETDCGTIFTSYAVIGPIAMAADGLVGTILSMDADVAEGSGPVTWALRPSLTFEGSLTAADSDTGTWVAGMNVTNRNVGRGQAFTLKLSNTTGRRWALENITAVLRDSGRRRMA